MTNVPVTDPLAPWQVAWPHALAAWSRYTRLREPQLCTSTVAAAREGLQGSFAMIRLADQRVVIDLEAAAAHGLAGLEVEILAHEIGHHVLAPASVTEHLRLLARMQRALPTLQRLAPMVANLYTDLLINDRLQRQAGLRMAAIYAALAQREGPGCGQVWQLYMGICEELWQCPGRLRSAVAENGGEESELDLATDAWLGARLVRVYANDWLAGAGRFATLLLPYLVGDAQLPAPMRGLMDTLEACEGADPGSVLDIEPGEAEGAIHPALDPAVSGLEPPEDEDEEPPASAAGQVREPSQYGAILRAAGMRLSDAEVAVRYYRERALPHLVPFPQRQIAGTPEPQLEALEPWDIGDSLDEIDWLHSVVLAPRPIPGMTTQRRSFGQEPTVLPRATPMDLDMYVDSSGSMPDPRVQTSWPTLAGAVIALSALRAGASVQVTLWSGARQVLATPGFIRDERAILEVLTGFFGGNTAFPIHRLRDTWCGPRLQPKPRARPAHILMISDNGIDTMFARDEQRNSGWDVAASALKAAGAGGTMALQTWRGGDAASIMAHYPILRRAAVEQGWQISAIQELQDLLDFARAFSRRHYTAGGST